MITFKNRQVYAVEKLFEAKLKHKGFQLPVAIYQIEETPEVFYHHCVCFENTRFEKVIEIALNSEGYWFDMADRDTDLAVSIGQIIDAQTEIVAFAMLQEV